MTLPTPIDTLVVRCDASSTIGLGHLMRSIVLACRLQAKKTIFAMQKPDSHMMATVHQNGFDTHILQSDKVEELITYITQNQASALSIDHYGIDANMEQQIKKATKIFLIAMDDTYEKHYADLLINPNLYAKDKHYAKLVPDFTQLWCGQKHLLLRDEFLQAKQIPINPNPSTNHILTVLIAMGGTDTMNLSIPIAQKALEHQVKIHIISTSANPHLSVLKEFANQKNAVQLYIDSQEVAALMRRADLAIISASSMFNEAVFLETPLIAIKTAENQHYVYQYAKNNGYQAINGFDETLLERSLKLMLSNYQLHNFTTLNDDQLQDILTWRNHPGIRQWMLNQHKITWNEHKEYVSRLKNNSKSQYFLCKCNGKPIGVVNFVGMENQVAEFGIYAVPDLHGAGKYLMRSALFHARNALQLQSLWLEVFEENNKAQKLFHSHGFKDIGEKKHKGKNMIIMEKQL